MLKEILCPLHFGPSVVLSYPPIIPVYTLLYSFKKYNILINRLRIPYNEYIHHHSVPLTPPSSISPLLLNFMSFFSFLFFPFPFFSSFLPSFLSSFLPSFPPSFLLSLLPSFIYFFLRQSFSCLGCARTHTVDLTGTTEPTEICLPLPPEC